MYWKNILEVREKGDMRMFEKDLLEYGRYNHISQILVI